MTLWGKSPAELEAERQSMLARREFTPAELGAKYAPPDAPMPVYPFTKHSIGFAVSDDPPVVQRPRRMHPLAIVIIAGLSCLGVIWIIEQIL